MDLHAFFKQAGVEEFTEVSLTDLTADDQTYVREFFPSASSAIIFGRPVPPGAYQLSPADQTREMLAIAEYLNETAIRLAVILRADGIPAEHIPLYLPVRIDGDDPVQPVCDGVPGVWRLWCINRDILYLRGITLKNEKNQWFRVSM